MGSGSSVQRSAEGGALKNQQPDIPCFKIVIIGESEVGKTALFNRFVKNGFTNVYEPTEQASIENVVRKVNLPYQTIVSLTLWDVPSRDDIDLSDAYYNDLHAAVVVVDVTDEESIGMCAYWKQRVLNTLSRINGTGKLRKVPFLLLGNKIDLVEDSINDGESEKSRSSSRLSSEDADMSNGEKSHRAILARLQKTAEEHAFLAGLLVSAKDPGGSVHTAMQLLIRHLIDKQGRQLPVLAPTHKRIKLKPASEEKRYKHPPLKLTQIEEIDSLILACKEHLIRTGELRRDFDLTFNLFKNCCAEAELVPYTLLNQINLEQCVTALKQKTGDGTELVAQECGVFIQLVLPDDIKPFGKISGALQVYNHKFAAACTSILLEGPSLRARLQDTDDQIAHRCDEMSDVLKDAQGQPTATAVIIEDNRVMITQAIMLLNELYQRAEQAKEKTIASLMW